MAIQAVQFRIDGKRVGGRLAVPPEAGVHPVGLEVPATLGEHTIVAELHEYKNGRWTKVAETPIRVITVRAFVEGL